MKLNPITALFDPIEKLINEHGSAAILRDQVSLFRDQLAILKEKFSVLEFDNIKLKTENQNLKTEIAELKKKIEEYKNSFHKKPPPKMEYVCPRCHEPAFKLIQNFPHPEKFFANSGVTVRFHRCGKCNYEETR